MFVVNHFWRADQFKYQCQTAQLVEHLTRVSRSNPGLFGHYSFHPVTMVTVDTPIYKFDRSTKSPGTVNLFDSTCRYVISIPKQINHTQNL